jgi:hypothetical protein
MLYSPACCWCCQQHDNKTKLLSGAVLASAPLLLSHSSIRCAAGSVVPGRLLLPEDASDAVHA